MNGIPDVACLIDATDIALKPFSAFLKAESAQLERYFPDAFRAGISVQASRVYLERIRCRAENREAFAFAIRAPDSDEIAGLVFLNCIYPEAGLAEAAGMIGARWEGEGLMHRAMMALFGWAQTELGLRRVRFLICDANTRSLSLAKGLGFRREPRSSRTFRPGTRFEELLAYHCLSLD